MMQKKNTQQNEQIPELFMKNVTQMSHKMTIVLKDFLKSYNKTLSDDDGDAIYSVLVWFLSTYSNTEWKNEQKGPQN